MFGHTGMWYLFPETTMLLTYNLRCDIMMCNFIVQNIVTYFFCLLALYLTYLNL